MKIYKFNSTAVLPLMTEHHQEINQDPLMLYFLISQKRLTLCLTNGCPRLKLKCHGIEGSLLRCFRSFLTDRKQRVVVRGTHSSWSCATSGVPQGTILGPILFLIYVNDISSNISSTLRMFPDDTKVYRELSNIARDIETLQFGVYQLVSWATKWQLRFNFDKCEVLRITHKCDLSSLHTYWA